MSRFISYKSTSNVFVLILTHLSLTSHKRDIGKQRRPRSDAAKCGVWLGSTLFALNTEIELNMVIIKTNQIPLRMDGWMDILFRDAQPEKGI